MKDLAVGQSAEKTRCFTSQEIAAYRQLTGDEALGYATTADVEATVPGPMIGGLISGLLGTELPGRGTNWLKQRYQFEKPALVNEEIRAVVEISRLRPEKALVNLSVTVFNTENETICTGETLVLVKDLTQ